MRKTALAALALVVLMGASRLAAQTASDSTLTPQEIKDRLDGITENLTTLNGDVAILKWVKLGGFLQYNYEYNDSSKSAGTGFVTGANNPNANNFYIRRGRVKFTIAPNSTSDYVFQFDGSKNTFTVKDAYMDLTRKFSDHQITMTAGQFNIPFGYEIELSDTKREFPERSVAEGKLFNGERDRGLNFTYTAPRYLQLNVGILQGYGIQDGTFTWFDPTKSKDFVGRAKAKLGKLDVGFSTYFGHTTIPGAAAVAAVPSVTTWFDANNNGVMDAGDSLKTTPGKAAVAAKPGSEFEKNRVGLDAQLYLDFLPIGATGIRGEFYGARDKGTPEQGWYLWLSQSVGKYFSGAVRYDFWDPNTNGAASNRAVGTFGFSAAYFYDANVRILLSYDIPHLLQGSHMFTKASSDIKDNKLTVQFQYAL